MISVMFGRQRIRFCTETNQTINSYNDNFKKARIDELAFGEVR